MEVLVWIFALIGLFVVLMFVLRLIAAVNYHHWLVADSKERNRRYQALWDESHPDQGKSAASSERRAGSWKLYVYGKDGQHSGAQWFRKPPLLYRDEITADEAFLTTAGALMEKLEIRVLDAEDSLVYHAKDGSVLHPPLGGNFWSEVTDKTGR